jgi:hypothetical protein
LIWLIKCAMCAMMPRTEALPGIEDTDVDGFLRRLRHDAQPIYWVGLVLGALLFTVTPLITVGIPVPAFLLPRALLERHTDRVLSHPLYVIRQAAYLVRLSAGMCWGADSGVRARFQLAPYPPDPGTFRSA